MIENLIDKTQEISLEFDKIREEVRGNIDNYIVCKVKRNSVVLYLKLALYSVILCLFCAIITIKIKDRIYENSAIDPIVPDEQTSIGPAGSIDPGKFPKSLLTEIFDVFVAFGSNTVTLFTDDIILNSNIISENDKNEFKKYLASQVNDYQKYYNIHIGVKDGKDIIYIKHLTAPYADFIFESVLNYDFDLIIAEFESMCEKKLSQDFLMSCDWDNELKIDKSGIHLYFKEEGGVYVPYYILMINEKVYILDK